MDSMNSKKVFKAGIGYIIGGILIKGIAFITTPIFTRLLTTEEFGILNSYLSYEAILAMVVGFQFAASLKSANIEFSGIKGTLSSYTKVIISSVLIHSSFITILVNLFPEQILQFTHLSNRLLLNLLIVNAAGNAILTIYNSYVSISYSYKKYVLIALINAILNITISLLLIKTVFASDASFGRILGYVIPYSIISLYIIYTVFRNSREDIHSKKSTKEYLEFSYKYCSPLLPNGFAEVMLGQFGKLTVDNNLGKSAMGIYSLSYNVYSIIGIIRIAMDYVVGPFYFEKRNSGDNRSLKTILNWYSRTLCIASIGIMILSPEIVRILGAPEYFDARFSAIPLVGASFFVFLVSMLSQEEYYSKKTYLVSISSVGTMIINIVMNILFVPKYGGIGAAFVTMGSYLIIILIHIFLIKYVLHSQVFDWKSIGIDCLLVSVMTFVSLLSVDKLIIRIILILLLAFFAVIHFKSINTIINLKERK